MAIDYPDTDPFLPNKDSGATLLAKTPCTL